MNDLSGPNANIGNHLAQNLSDNQQKLMQQNQQYYYQNTNAYQSANSMNDVRNSKKGKKEKKSDWICPRCDNLNYSFRKFCNRCQILR
jgi:hypothetical protein